MSDARPDVYDLFRRGSALLESGDYSAAAISLEKTGRHEEARRHLALACNLRPERADYRTFRDRLRAA